MRLAAGRAKRVGVVLLALCASVVLVQRSCQYLEAEGYRQGVPASIEVSELVFIQSSGGFREGCGTGVFAVSSRTLQAIRAEGIGFFKEARMGRDNGRYYKYAEWGAAPVPKNSEVLRGLGCAGAGEEMRQTLWHAASSQGGAYYSTGYEYDILVIPSLGWVVVSQNG